MTRDERDLWMGLGYCYEWYRGHPEDKEECDKLARNYIRYYEIRKGKAYLCTTISMKSNWPRWTR